MEKQKLFSGPLYFLDLLKSNLTIFARKLPGKAYVEQFTNLQQLKKAPSREL